MTRRRRIHVPGGVYYVVQHGSARRPVFTSAEEYALFDTLLVRTLSRTGSALHAYSWMPGAIHLALRTGDVPLSRVMQQVTSMYAQTINTRDGVQGPFFPKRYRSLLIDPDEYLLKLIQYIHYLPCLANLARDPNAYAHTSHRAYCDISRVADAPRPGKRPILELPKIDPPAYEALMSRPPSAEDVRLFTGRGCDQRVLAGPEFIAGLPLRLRLYRSRMSLDQIVHDVSRVLGVRAEEVLSSARRHDLSLARALIAWFAVERRVATVTHVARLMNRDVSTLSIAIRRYRARRPDLFRLDALRYLRPIATQREPPA